MFRKLAIAAAMLALSGAATAQTVSGLDGRWEGALTVENVTLPLVMRVATANGATTAVLDSPAQNATDIPATLTRDDDAVKLDLPIIAGAYAGKLSADGKTIAGTWSQGGYDLPLDLTRK